MGANLASAAPLLIPLAGGRSAAAALLISAFYLYGLGLGVSKVHSASIRQTVTLDRLLGHMNAGYCFLIYGAIPLGALLGGALREAGLVGLPCAHRSAHVSPPRSSRPYPRSLSRSTIMTMPASSRSSSSSEKSASFSMRKLLSRTEGCFCMRNMSLPYSSAR